MAGKSNSFPKESDKIFKGNSNFEKQIGKVRETIERISRFNIKINININNNQALKSILETNKALKSIEGKSAGVDIKAKDQTKGVISGIKKNISSLKGIILGDTSKKIFDFTIGEAMRREDKFASNSGGTNNTASTQIKNIKESFAGLGTNLVGVKDNGEIEKGGVFDIFKQQLSKILPLLDKFKNSDAFKLIKKDLNAFVALLSKIPSVINGFKKSDVFKLIKKDLDAFVMLLSKIPGLINKFKKSDAFKSIQKSLNDLMPVFMKIHNVMNKYIMSSFKFFKDIGNKYVMPAIVSISGIVKKYGPSIVETFIKIADKIEPQLKKFWGIIEKNIIPIIQDLWGKVQKILPGIGDLFSSAFDISVIVMGKAVDIFGNVSDGVKSLYDKISPFLDWIAELFNKVAGGIREAVNWLEKWIDRKGNGKNLPGGGPGGLLKDSGQNALGTSYWRGGWTLIGEQGPELMKLPGGAQILDNRTSQNMLGGSVSVEKLADTLVVREDSDIDRIADALAKKLTKVGFNCV
ncbi:hypothetical protein [Clostridium aciditolerans]|uniref:Uncharacterized protein n=1 Tax=Clostridium aciditolerans TaxID=339861 RepID=A0A934HZS4_9CLOT|nr:hypothetical protein [Clostridium aciditolerans]MBI6873743.1 hypothetical protein [Clostridium aciditolerans]